MTEKDLDEIMDRALARKLEISDISALVQEIRHLKSEVDEVKKASSEILDSLFNSVGSIWEYCDTALEYCGDSPDPGLQGASMIAEGVLGFITDKEKVSHG